MAIDLNNKKMNIFDKGSAVPRCYWRTNKKTKKSASVLIKCGDCNEKVEIYYDEAYLEVNGVNASIEWWQMLIRELILKGGR